MATTGPGAYWRWVAAAALLVTGRPAAGELVTWSNPAAIALSDPVDGVVTPSTPYPSSIVVTGVYARAPRKVVVQVRLTHTFPDDVDLLLAGPRGQSVMLLSDAGSSINVTNLLLTFDDEAAAAAPDAGGLAEGSYRPANYGAVDSLPPPAPSPASATSLWAFAGVNPHGEWRLFAVDDALGDTGFIGGWSLTLDLTNDVPETGEVIVSEYRAQGPFGALDEYVELYNGTDGDFIVATLDGSAGWAVAASDGATRFVVPTGLVFRAGAHFLGVNSAGFSLGGYAAGTGTVGMGDASYTAGIGDSSGIALFRTASPGGFVASNRLDAVGPAAEGNPLYREGPGHPTLYFMGIDGCFVRRLHDGAPRDTGDNATDFLFMDTEGFPTPAGERLGAPGPKSRASPARSPAGPAALSRAWVDPAGGPTGAANRVRDPTSDPIDNRKYGALVVRRRFTNTSAHDLTRLRFRVAEITSYPPPADQADLRPLTIGAATVSVTGAGTEVVGGTTRDDPPVQYYGGALNSSVSSAVSVTDPLPAGGSTNLQLRFGIEQTGRFRLLLIPETIPPAVTPCWLVTGHTETNADLESDGGEIIRGTARADTDVIVSFTATPFRRYQLQASSAVADGAVWQDVGEAVTGVYAGVSAADPGGAAAATGRYHRVRVAP